MMSKRMQVYADVLPVLRGPEGVKEEKKDGGWYSRLQVRALVAAAPMFIIR